MNKFQQWWWHIKNKHLDIHTCIQIVHVQLIAASYLCNYIHASSQSTHVHVGLIGTRTVYTTYLTLYLQILLDDILSKDISAQHKIITTLLCEYFPLILQYVELESFDVAFWLNIIDLFHYAKETLGINLHISILEFASLLK